MKFSIELEERERTVLLQMVFLGEYVVNSHRRAGTESVLHADVADKLYRAHYLETAQGCPEEDIEENEIADIRDRLFDSVQKDLEDFEEDVCMENAFFRGKC